MCEVCVRVGAMEVLMSDAEGVANDVQYCDNPLCQYCDKPLCQYCDKPLCQYCDKPLCHYCDNLCVIIVINLLQVPPGESGSKWHWAMKHAGADKWAGCPARRMMQVSERVSVCVCVCVSECECKSVFYVCMYTRML